MACIHEIEPAVLLNAAARKAAIRIIRPVRVKRDGLALPVHEIAARHMSPMHRPPLRLIGIMLIEEMILAAEIGKAVRIIAPADPRRDVEPRVPALVDLGFVSRDEIIRRKLFLFI